MLLKYSKSIRLFIFFVLLILSAWFLYVRYVRGPVLPDELNDKTLNENLIGVYDRKALISDSLPYNIQYLSVKWKNADPESNISVLEEKISKSKNLLLTLEIWPPKNQNVLHEILDGTYDAKIRQLALLIGRRQDILLRFLSEMEIPVQEFPWQYQSPEQYIKAFNYFGSRLKKLAPGIRMVWSPAGYPGDSEFWPGTDNVDVISVTVGSKSELKSKAYPVDTGLTVASLKSKIHRMRFMDKPILVLSAVGKADRLEVSVMLKKVRHDADSFKNTIYSPRYFQKDTGAWIKREKLIIGAYDPRQVLLKEPELKVEHLFTDWGEIQSGDFSRKFQDAVKRKHEVIVTMEPWRALNNRQDSSVLQNTIRGKYDREIKELYRIISNSGQQVYLRWAHEMEIPIHRYSWQSKLPVDYINSYRYFMKFKKEGDGISRVWGPAGDRGSADWYPGDDVVDYISIAIYGLPDKNITDEDQQESFRTIFERKSYRMRLMNKPFFITEFGVKGTESYKKRWLENAAVTIRQNPQIFGVCYFNLFDNPEVWGDIKAPDWSITKDIFKGFCKLLQNNLAY